jgi:hypothetical protein
MKFFIHNCHNRQRYFLEFKYIKCTTNGHVLKGYE